MAGNRPWPDKLRGKVEEAAGGGDQVTMFNNDGDEFLQTALESGIGILDLIVTDRDTGEIVVDRATGNVVYTRP